MKHIHDGTELEVSGGNTPNRIESKKAVSIEAKNRKKVAEFREMVLASDLPELLLTTVMTARQCLLCPDTQTVIVGEPLTPELHFQYCKLVISKVISTPKDMSKDEEEENVSLLKAVLKEIDREKTPTPTIDVDIDVEHLD